MYRVTNGGFNLEGGKFSRLGTHDNGQPDGAALKGVRSCGEVSSDDPAYLSFCICGKRGCEPCLWLLKGITTALVGDTAVSVDSARIDPPSTEELDSARYASSIPRSFVDHTKACTYCDELRRRRFTMLRGGESENERLHVWCSRAPSMEM